MVQVIVKNAVQVCETATDDEQRQRIWQSDIAQLLASCHSSSSPPRATVATEGVWHAVCGCYREGQRHLLSSLQRVSAVHVHVPMYLISEWCVG